VRRALARGVGLPVLTVGWFAAHWLGYRIAIPNPQERATALAQSGHGYFSYLPFLFAAALALFVVAIALQICAAARGAVAKRPLAWPFLVLPPLIFTAEEYTDRLVHDGTLQVATVVERTFVIGLLVQIPVGLVSYAVVRVLLRWADGLGTALAAFVLDPPQALKARLLVRPARSFDAPRRSVFAAGQVDRGPPCRVALADAAH
jgi:hypothetical protein